VKDKGKKTSSVREEPSKGKRNQRIYMGRQSPLFLELLQLPGGGRRLCSLFPAIQSFRIFFGIEKGLSLGTRILRGERRYHRVLRLR